MTQTGKKIVWPDLPMRIMAILIQSICQPGFEHSNLNIYKQIELEQLNPMPAQKHHNDSYLYGIDIITVRLWMQLESFSGRIAGII